MSRGEVDGGGDLPRQVDAGRAGRDHGRDHVAHPPAREIVRLERVGRDVHPALDRPDAVDHDVADVHLAQFHPHHVEQPHPGVARQGLHVQVEELEEEREHDQRRHGDDADHHPQDRADPLGGLGENGRD